jgi:hypothetical protein
MGNLSWQNAAALLLSMWTAEDSFQFTLIQFFAHHFTSVCEFYRGADPLQRARVGRIRGFVYTHRV